MDKDREKIIIKLLNGKKLNLKEIKTEYKFDNYNLILELLNKIECSKLKRSTKYNDIKYIENIINFIEQLIDHTLLINKDIIIFEINNCIDKINKGINLIKDDQILNFLKNQVNNLNMLKDSITKQNYINDIFDIFDSILYYIEKTNDFLGFNFLFNKNQYLYGIKEFGSNEFIELLFKLFDNETNEEKINYYIDIFSFIVLSFNPNINYINSLLEDNTKHNKLKTVINKDYKKIYIEPKFIENNINQNDLILDLRKENSFTLDINGTKTCEDAFIINKNNDGTFKLTICITDVDRYVKEGSQIDLFAYNIGCNVNYKNHFIKMLPNEIISACSLNKNTNRYCLAYVFILDDQLNIINHYVKKALINIKESYYYNELNNLIKTGRINSYIELLIELSDKLEKENPQIKEYHDIKQKHNKNIIYNNGASEKIITQLKIMLNSVRSEYYYNLGLPYIYKNNKILNIKPTINEIITTFNNPKVKDIYENVKMEYGLQIYSSENQGHVGLNKKAYGQMSIPLRNYAALFNQRMDNKFVLNTIPFTDSDVYMYLDKAKEISQHLNRQFVLNKAIKYKI